jgi:hypothetical protein
VVYQSEIIGLCPWDYRVLATGSTKGYAFKNRVGDWIPPWMRCTSVQKIAQVTLVTEIMTKKSSWTEEPLNMTQLSYEQWCIMTLNWVYFPAGVK